MATVGPGVREIRAKAEDGEYRVMYVASFETAIYVLHAFEKKTSKTAKVDIDLAKTRYKQVKRAEERARK